MKKDRFGWICIACSVLLLAVALILYVVPLEHWRDVLFMVLWLFGPAVAGAVLYQCMENRGRWAQDQILK